MATAAAISSPATTETRRKQQQPRIAPSPHHSSNQRAAHLHLLAQNATASTAPLHLLHFRSHRRRSNQTHKPPPPSLEPPRTSSHEPAPLRRNLHHATTISIELRTPPLQQQLHHRSISSGHHHASAKPVPRTFSPPSQFRAAAAVETATISCRTTAPPSPSRTSSNHCSCGTGITSLLQHRETRRRRNSTRICTTPRRRRSQSSRHCRQLRRHVEPREEGAANPNSGERVLCATCQHLIGQSNWSTGQLVNSGQLVKVSSQLWSKLQIWLKERGRIGNWTAIKLLIN